MMVSEERKKKIAFLQELKWIRGYWFNKIFKYTQKIHFIELEHSKWMADDEKFLKKIQDLENMKYLATRTPDIIKIPPENFDNRIAHMFYLREQNTTIEVKIERLKEKIKNLKSESAKLKVFIDEEFKKLHKERDKGLFDLIEKIKQE